MKEGGGAASIRKFVFRNIHPLHADPMVRFFFGFHTSDLVFCSSSGVLMHGEAAEYGSGAWEANDA